MAKVLLCCIGKEENHYIKEYVDYYRNLGFAGIHLYDNNVPDGEHFEDVLQSDIDDGFVKLIDYRGRELCQLAAYQDCYDKEKNNYDWICFFDCDEFLTFKSKNVNVSTYFDNPKFKDFDMIHVNWMVYGDNDVIDGTGKPVLTTYKKPMMPFNKCVRYSFPENCHVKSIIRGGLDCVTWKITSHSPLGVEKCCNPRGVAHVSVDGNPYCKYDFSEMWLRHYITKSVTEYVRKVLRGYPDTLPKKEQMMDAAERFFNYGNKPTPQKIKIIEDAIGMTVTGKTLHWRPFYERWYANL